MSSGKAAAMARTYHKNKKAPSDRLASEIKGILAEYQVSVTEEVREAVKKVTSAGAKALRAESKRAFGGSGRYAKGWKSRLVTGARTKQGIIYNADVPGLPHLLEYGHANRNGGRTPGRIHIKTIEDQIVNEFEKEVVSGI